MRGHQITSRSGTYRAETGCTGSRQERPFEGAIDPKPPVVPQRSRPSRTSRVYPGRGAARSTHAEGCDAELASASPASPIPSSASVAGSGTPVGTNSMPRTPA
jgi:hypothetical protein